MRRGLILSVCAFAALTAGVGSCTASSTSTVSTTGKTLTIYMSVPREAAGAADIAAAARLAFQQQGTKVGQFTIKLANADSPKLSDNARKAIEDPSAIAYIGELAPGDSADSIGITNAADVLQVSPTDTALELTQATAAVPGAPGIYYESQKSYGRTFARVVPNTAQEARAQAQEMAKLHVRTLYVSGDGSAYGAALARALRQRALPAAGISVISSAAGADGAVYAGSSGSGAASAFRSSVTANPKIKLFAPSALASVLPRMDHSVYVSTPGFAARDLPPLGVKFVADFNRAFGHQPASGAIFGYEAMSAVLAVLREAGSSANDRSTVVRDFFAIRNRSSALGTYSINSAGDTSIAPFVWGRLAGGVLVPLRSNQAQG